MNGVMQPLEENLYLTYKYPYNPIIKNNNNYE